MVTKPKLPDYKSEIIEYVARKGSLTITPDAPRTLKSKRVSPHFLNSGMLDDGESVLKLGAAYGKTVLANIGSDNFDVVFGPPYKGIPLSAITAGGIMLLGENKKYAFYRKEEKVHGEGSGSGESKSQKQKRLIVGEIRDGAKPVIVDDVITAGGAKLEALEVLDAVAERVAPAGGVILLDRQELNEQGEATIEKFARENSARLGHRANATRRLAYTVASRSLHSCRIRSFGILSTNDGEASDQPRDFCRRTLKLPLFPFRSGSNSALPSP